MNNRLLTEQKGLLIVVPQMPKQEVTAGRSAELGLGVRFAKHEVTPRSLREAVESVVANDLMRANISAAQRSVQSAGGTGRAADLLVQFQP